ncbi:MAG TPA: hypothetical protein VGD38_07665 [Pyrinomonadaceae bacterium]
MNTKVKTILVLSLLVILQSVVAAQDRANRPETEKKDTVEDLQLQLIELQSKEDTLRIRAQQLDEDLKPENIERSLAGIGSTRPEDLREMRRRQLTIERESVRAQLKILEKMRARLEAAIGEI